MEKNSKKSISPLMLELVAAKLKVLADPLRLKIVHLLMEGEKSVSEIQKHLKCSQPNVSKHLQLLTTQHILTRRKEGVSVFYSVGDDTIFEICTLMCGEIERSLKEKSGNIS